MKSLLDIQQDIRDLEADVKEITERIRNISSDIDDMRNVDPRMEFDYGRIEILAGQIPFARHPLDELEDGRACLIYLEMLLNIVRMDHEIGVTVNRLIFIQWMQIQSRIDRPLKELVEDTYRTQADLFEEFAQIVPKEYMDVFVLDALIVANIGGEANGETLEYLAEVSALLGIDAEKLRMLAQIARAVLCQKFGGMEKEQLREVLKYTNEFKFYLDADIIEKAVQEQREIIVELDDLSELKWVVKHNQKVQKGDIVAIIYAWRKQSDGKDYFWRLETRTRYRAELKAPSSGTIFQFRHNNMNYGVISIETDSRESIKAWIKDGGH